MKTQRIIGYWLTGFIFWFAFSAINGFRGTIIIFIYAIIFVREWIKKEKEGR